MVRIIYHKTKSKTRSSQLKQILSEIKEKVEEFTSSDPISLDFDLKSDKIASKIWEKFKWLSHKTNTIFFEGEE